MNKFREYVLQNLRWFSGRGRETEESLNNAESKLGIEIPADIRWLLIEHGYWHATGISSLDETVEDTLAAREHLNLPHRFIVLYNHQDGGVILLDTELSGSSTDHKVYNTDWNSIPDHMEDEIVYESYLVYVQHQLELKQGIIEQEHIDDNPDDHPFD